MSDNVCKIPSPAEFFGVVPGDDKVMIRWNKLCDYYYTVAELSGRVHLREMGLTTEGNPFLMLFVSSEKNIERLEYYRSISKKLSDAREMSEKEIQELSREGKVVVMQSYSLHSNEVGGAQMVPLMLYDLVCAPEGSELYNALENAIFIISPCSEPDGEITFTDWYNKYVNTKYEGYYSPYIRHTMSGHANNRDAMRESVVESRYINDILLREWVPQIFMDYHHQYPYEPRMSLPPAGCPFFESCAPMVAREASVYGAQMAQALSRADCKGIVFGDENFPWAPYSTFYNWAALNNITGMLSESADANIASPVYILPQRLTRYDKFPTPRCPEPWEGGEWHLRDIVKQMYVASLTLFKYAANNSESILSDMAHKSISQTKRGQEDKDYAYMISQYQHDKSAMRLLLRLMIAQNIEVHKLNKDVVCGSKTFVKGTYAVLLSQPKYAAIKVFLKAIPYQISKHNAKTAMFDIASSTMALGMGIDVCGASAKIPADSLSRVYEIEEEKAVFPLCAQENISFKHVNDAFDKKVHIYRDAKGNFYDRAGDGLKELKRAKVGLLKKSFTGGDDEPFARNILTTYNFDFEIVMDKVIRETGVPDDIDVLIIPGDNSYTLCAGDAKITIEGVVDESAPPEYQSGLGKNGQKELIKFVERGGRLIGWERTIEYINKVFDLQMRDASAEMSKEQYTTHGSHLKANIKEDELTYGMPKFFNLMHNDAFSLIPILDNLFINSKIDVLAHFDKDDVYVNGYIRGEEYLKGTPCMLRARRGKGDIVMYTFNPTFRLQQDAAFKLLFNALYK